MKDNIDKKSRQALVNYRFQRSGETMREAEVMFREEFYNATINRLYYACHYAVSALLLQRDIHAYTHKGMKTMFALHAVTTGEVPEEIASAYFTLFEKRHSGDYDDFIFFSRAATLELIEQADAFIKTVEKLIGENDTNDYSQ